MSKLTEIKDTLKVLDNRENYSMVNFLMAVNKINDNYPEWIPYLLSLLEEKEDIGFWERHERYSNKVYKCLEQAEEIKRLNTILEEKDKALNEICMRMKDDPSVVYNIARTALLNNEIGGEK